MGAEIKCTIFERPTPELLIAYATHLKGALEQARDGECVVRTPSGEFTDAETRVRGKALGVCADLIAMGQQAKVVELFPSLKDFIEVPVAPQNPSSPISSQAFDGEI